MAAFSAGAPRDLVNTTKASIRTTSALTEHAGAVTVEVGPQLASLRSPGSKEGFEQIWRR